MFSQSLLNQQISEALNYTPSCHSAEIKKVLEIKELFNNRLSYILPVLTNYMDEKLASNFTDNVVTKLIGDLLEVTGTARS